VGHITGRRGGVSAEERLTGYRRAMQRADLPTDGLVVDGDYLQRSGEVGAERLVAAGANAIFCASDAMAIGALRALERLGRAVPDDVAVAGFDDLPQASETSPPLTTMRQDTGRLGIEAAHALFRLLGDREAAPQRVILPTELVIRQSTVGPLGRRRRPGS
jgi:DNA-binding LacI/PurR family transcriptional regulator